MNRITGPASSLWIASFTLLVSCSGIEREAETAVADASGRIDAASQEFFSVPTKRASGVQVEEREFVGPARERTPPADRLPDSLKKRQDISIVSRTPLSLEEIASRLNEITNVPFIVTLGSNGQRTFTTDQTPGVEIPARDTIDVPEDDATPSQVAVGMSPESSPSAFMRIRPNLSGSLGSVLDQVAAAFEVEWDYQDGRVLFRDFVTRRYQVTLLPSDVDTSFDAGPVNRTNALDFWGEVRQAVENLLGTGATVTYGTSTGIVTVTARLSDHANVRSYIVELNEQLGQQIAFDINVLSVILRDESDLSVTLSAALKEQNITGEFSSPASSFTGGGSFNVGVTSGSVDVSAVVRSLAKRGRVAVETRAGGITTNFQPVPISVTERIGYIASTQSNFDDTGNLIGTDVTTDTIEVGFVLLVLPRILNSREVLMNYSISLSTNNGFQQLGDIQLPNTSQQILDQQAIVRNGQSLVIAGFEERQSEVEKSGVASERFLGLGGRRGASAERESTVIIITPRLLSRASAP